MVNLPMPSSNSAMAPTVSIGWPPERGHRILRRITRSAAAKSPATSPNPRVRWSAMLFGPRSGWSTASPLEVMASSGSTTAGSSSYSTSMRSMASSAM